jgi:capsular polysaccharide biosynthesis protein
LELRDYFKVLRKRWWVIALVAVIAVTSAYGFSKTQATIWRSTIKLSIEPSRLSDYGSGLAVKQILRNYAIKLTTLAMAQKVIDQLQLDIRPETLLGKVAVSSDEADYTIQIEAKDQSGANAVRIVQTFADLFVQDRQINNLQQAQQDRVLTSIVDNPSAPDIFSPKTSINVLAGGVLGALLGVIIVLGLEWLESDVVRSTEDVERYIGLPVIGSIPTITTREGAPGAAPRTRSAFWNRV